MAWTTRVSNPVCYPCFRPSASVSVQEAAFASGVPPNLYEFHLYTGNSASLSRTRVTTVLSAVPRLSRGISHPTYRTTYGPFTPSNSEQRLHPPYYRGCWHGVSRCFLARYRQDRSPSSLPTELYNPQAFITHAAWLDQAFAHCPIFPTAASRRSLGRVSVPVWLIILSDQLPIEALVSRYLTNKLMGRRPIPGWPKPLPSRPESPDAVCGISACFQTLFPAPGYVAYVLLTRAPLMTEVMRSTCMC